jgi:hypothetical protein
MTMTDEINRLLACLQERFPAAFPADPRACRPLNVGIREDLITALAGEFPQRRERQPPLPQIFPRLRQFPHACPVGRYSA